MRPPRLQLALDFEDLDAALMLTRRVAPFVDLVEAGTPLIKSEGLKRCLPALGRLSRRPLVADLKTADAAGFECAMACRWGAAGVTLLGGSPRENIAEGISAARSLGLALTVDMIGTPDVAARAPVLAAMGARNIGIHFGISQQKAVGGTGASGRNPFRREQIHQTAAAIAPFGGRLVVAGGINPDNLVHLQGIPNLETVIVGGFLTASPDPVEAVQDLRAAMRRVFSPQGPHDVFSGPEAVEGAVGPLGSLGE